MEDNKFRSKLCISIGEFFPTMHSYLIEGNLAEIRFDLMDSSPTDYISFLEEGTKLIACCRSGKKSETERLDLYRQAIAAKFTYIDLDIGQDFELYQNLNYEIGASSTKLIASYHNYEETPSLDFLRSLIETAESYQSDIIKIATTINQVEEIAVLNKLYPNSSLIAFGMGTLGKQSRLDCLTWGAPFTYVYPDGSRPTASGQWSYSEIMNWHKQISTDKP